MFWLIAAVVAMGHQQLSAVRTTCGTDPISTMYVLLM